MKIPNSARSLIGPVGAVLLVVLLAWLTLSAASDPNNPDSLVNRIRREFVKFGFLVALGLTVARLALGVVGWPLWLLAGASFFFSGTGRDVLYSLGIGSGAGTPGEDCSVDVCISNR